MAGVERFGGTSARCRQLGTPVSGFKGLDRAAAAL